MKTHIQEYMNQKDPLQTLETRDSENVQDLRNPIRILLVSIVQLLHLIQCFKEKEFWCTIWGYVYGMWSGVGPQIGKTMSIFS